MTIMIILSEQDKKQVEILLTNIKSLSLISRGTVKFFTAETQREKEEET